MGKRDRGNNAGPGAKKFSKLSNKASQSSMESLLRRRVLAQKTRLTRALQRCGSDNSQKLAVHMDGVKSYEEAATQQDEIAEQLRLEHLRGVHTLLTTKTDALSESEIQSAKDLRVSYLLGLLEMGDAVEASEMLETWTEPPTGRDITPNAYSNALIAFINWQGGDEPVGGDEEACEKKANEAMDLAIATNPYVGVFLSNLAVFVREIDPSVAAEALHISPSNQSKDETAACDSEDDDGPKGKFEGSIEECMAYAARAAGCWMDFLEYGVDEWVGDRLNDYNEGNIEWPPRRCSHEGKALLDLFVYTAEIAEKVQEAKGDDDEEDNDEEEDDE